MLSPMCCTDLYVPPALFLGSCWVLYGEEEEWLVTCPLLVVYSTWTWTCWSASGGEPQN